MANTGRQDDWRCKQCRRWHRRKTVQCQCGAIPRRRVKRSEIMEAKAQWRPHVSSYMADREGED